MKKSLLLAAALICAVSVAFAGGGAQGGGGGGDKIAIGAVLTISGQNGFYGTESRDGALLAIEHINAAGGVLGKQLTLIPEDDESDASKAVNAFTKLSTRDKVSYIIGASLSGTTMAFTAQAQAAKIVLISPSATNAKVTDPGEFIFRACFIDPFQGIVAANFAYDTLKAKKAAVLYDAGTDYNTGLATEFKKNFQKAGGQIVADEAYQTGDVDFNAQVTRIKAAAPDVVYLPNYYQDVTLQLKQLRAQGINVPALGGDGWDSLVANADDSALNGYWTSFFSKDSTAPKAQAFVKAYEAKFNKPANSFSALGYDCAMLIADAIKKAGTTDSTAVAKALAAIQGEYVTGAIKFDSHRDPIKGAVINEIVKQNGKLVDSYKTTVNPK
jgi:branched-chain amino acid transport system substrate-binding protein